jgi:hypothetical protein
MTMRIELRSMLPALGTPFSNDGSRMHTGALATHVNVLRGPRGTDPGPPTMPPRHVDRPHAARGAGHTSRP